MLAAKNVCLDSQSNAMFMTSTNLRHYIQAFDISSSTTRAQFEMFEKNDRVPIFFFSEPIERADSWWKNRHF